MHNRNANPPGKSNVQSNYEPNYDVLCTRATHEALPV